MLVRSSTMKSRKSLARDVFDTFATPVRLVDIRDRDCWAQGGSTHSRAVSRDFRTSVLNRTKHRVKKQG